ncbi:tRNA dihydrouridine synthase [Methanimicrococcus blatticola]|uniref:NifR3 family TIM-barrel protein n=1 Tax=Methanimicrococcus blatticola TaxID=91560 RepID=A0A484F703_9EURY|nr:tRNA-dihydrouridine synthase family protein [Methanimicrococcus blatticola]MBZ3936106.1 tRNA-dihydrouridine synthase family protein [Methanimicrococcus blatticola]MCC2508349.1 tRNA-dihydrouridine synthase family protein [Methanimicrococcus blatticola]TDQ70198.1 nifR3 family TIM-barrel protein [Methanimicrococcus blatticola]
MFYDFNPKKPVLFLAPMADVTNPAFRFVAHGCGADFTYSEMIHSDGFNHGDPYAKNRGFSIDGVPYGVQIVGSDSELIAKAAAGLEKMFSPAAKVIDINMGCPSPPITKTGCGAALMAQDFGAENHPASIIRRVCEMIETPVTAKIRIYNDDEKTLRLAKSLEDAGTSAITVHGRTRGQMYSGNANWEIIAKIKKELSIPVILNGDIVDEKSLQTAMDLTNCDGYMVGRAAIGNPSVFRRLKFYLENGEPANMSQTDDFSNRVDDFNRYFFFLQKYDLLPHVNIRAHAQWFTKGLPYSREMRLKINDLHKDVRIRHFSDDELAEERSALAFEISGIFAEYNEKCALEYGKIGDNASF